MKAKVRGAAFTLGCGLAAGVAPAAADAPIEKNFGACPIYWQIVYDAVAGDKLQATFRTTNGGIQFRIFASDTGASALDIDESGSTALIDLTLSKPGRFETAGLIALLTARRQLSFSLFYHPLPAPAAPTQMAVDRFVFTDNGALCP